MDVRGQTFQGALGAGQALAFGGDAGLSRDAAGVVDVGNGAPGDKSGTINAAKANLATGAIISAAPSLTISQTWNNNGVAFTAAVVSVTNTQSASGSLLLDLQVGALSMFHVDRQGIATANGGFVSAGGYNAFANYRQSSISSGYVINDDVGFYRGAPAVMLLGNGANGDISGTLKLSRVNLAPKTFASLPGSPSDGDRAFVIDATAATFGSTVAGGGSNHVPVYYDGSVSAWKVG